MVQLGLEDAAALFLRDTALLRACSFCLHQEETGRSPTSIQWVRLHRVCPGCDQAVGLLGPAVLPLPLDTSAPSSLLHAQQ